MNTPTRSEVVTRPPLHSRTPWTNNQGTIETPSGNGVCYVYGADTFPCLTPDEFVRVEAECAANARVIQAAPALLHNLTYAVWCFVNGIAPTADAIATMLVAVRQGNGEGGVS